MISILELMVDFGMLNRQLSQSLEVDVNRFGVQIVACSCQVGQHGVQSVHVQTGRSLCIFCLPWYLSGVPQNKQCSLSETQNWQIDAHAQCMPLEPPVTVTLPFSDVSLSRQLGAEVVPAFDVYNLSRCDTDISLP